MIEIIIDKEEEKKTIGVIENGKLIEVYEAVSYTHLTLPTKANV